MERKMRFDGKQFWGEKTDEGKTESVLSDLLCCPFCGEFPKFWHIVKGENNEHESMYIYCDNRKCLIQPRYPNVPWRDMPKENAIKAWNQRAR